jgi:hypothetical protein
MKTAAKIAGAILVCLVLVLVVLRISGLNPIGDTPGPRNYPGLWLSGQVVTTPVTDWSFVTKYRTDKVQTRTWFLIPHSVTTGFIVYKGQLYLTSMFPTGMPFPQGKMWVSDVMRDPHVRLKFGDKLYDCILSPVSDPDERAAVLESRAIRNPQPTASSATSGRVMHLFHAVSQ